MIYSDAFDQIPNPARDLVYRRLYDVLSGKDVSGQFTRLSSADRQAILEILPLRDTKPDLPAYFKEAPSSHPSPGAKVRV